MRSFRTSGNGISLNVLEWPAQSASPALPTVLLLHGFMDAAATWDLVAPALADRGHRVLAPDLRGFGESDAVPLGGYYHFPDYVADVARLVTDHVEGPLHLVGHSMGGTVATLYTGARPERVTKLAVLEGIGPPDHPYEAAPVRMRRWLHELDHQPPHGTAAKSMTNADALARLKTNHARIDDTVLRSRLVHLTRAVTGGGLAWRFDPLHRTTSPMPFFSKVFEAFARSITCPVLYVSGGPLGYRTPDEDERLAAFANLTRVDLPDAGHMMHWTAPDQLIATLGEFLRSTP